MAGNKGGGVKARDTNYEMYGQEFYRRIGQSGGRAGKTGGFAAGEKGRERARVYGAIGGALSRRNRDKHQLSDYEHKQIYKRLLKVHEASIKKLKAQ